MVKLDAFSSIQLVINQKLNYRFAECILGAGEIRWNLGEAQLCEWGYCVCQIGNF